MGDEITQQVQKVLQVAQRARLPLDDEKAAQHVDESRIKALAEAFLLRKRVGVRDHVDDEVQRILAKIAEATDSASANAAEM